MFPHTNSLSPSIDENTGHILAWAKGSKLDLTLDGTLENVSVYAQRVLSREAHERAWRKEMAQIAEN